MGTACPWAAIIIVQPWRPEPEERWTLQAKFLKGEIWATTAGCLWIRISLIQCPQQCSLRPLLVHLRPPLSTGSSSHNLIPFSKLLPECKLPRCADLLITLTLQTHQSFGLRGWVLHPKVTKKKVSQVSKAQCCLEGWVWQLSPLAEACLQPAPSNSPPQSQAQSTDLYLSLFPFPFSSPPLFEYSKEKQFKLSGYTS